MSKLGAISDSSMRKFDPGLRIAVSPRKTWSLLKKAGASYVKAIPEIFKTLFRIADQSVEFCGVFSQTVGLQMSITLGCCIGFVAHELLEYRKRSSSHRMV